MRDRLTRGAGACTAAHFYNTPLNASADRPAGHARERRQNNITHAYTPTRHTFAHHSLILEKEEFLERHEEEGKKEGKKNGRFQG